MRPAGEPIFEDDFPPGGDMIAQVREGPSLLSAWNFAHLTAYLMNAHTWWCRGTYHHYDETVILLLLLLYVLYFSQSLRHYGLLTREA